MNALLVLDAASRLGVTPEVLFRLSFEYEEHPHSRKFIIERYLDWYHSNKVHEDVESFVIDVLAGRVTR